MYASINYKKNFPFQDFFIKVLEEAGFKIGSHTESEAHMICNGREFRAEIGVERIFESLGVTLTYSQTEKLSFFKEN